MKYQSWVVVINNIQSTEWVKLPTYQEKKDSFDFAVISNLDLPLNGENKTFERLKDLQADTENPIDFVFHNGGFGNEIAQSHSKELDDYFDRLSELTQKIPYLALPGTPESNIQNPTLFNFRFMNPGIFSIETTRNAIFTFVYKDTQFFSIDLDLYLKNYEIKKGMVILYWLNFVLAKSTAQWKTVIISTPLYCANYKDRYCVAISYFLNPLED